MNMPSLVLKLAGLIVLAGSPAPHSPAAVVEEITGRPAGLQFMDYVEAGQVINLGPQDKIVLGYLSSCWRETIIGGTVTVGPERSDVLGGMVERSTIDCGGNNIQLTPELANKSAAMVFRDMSHSRIEQARPQVMLYGRSPIIEVKPTGKIVIERLDRAGERYEIPLGNAPLVHGAFLDLSNRGVVLAAGGIYRAKAGAQQIEFVVNPHAKAGRTPVAGRLLRLQPET